MAGRLPPRDGGGRGGAPAGGGDRATGDRPTGGRPTGGRGGGAPKDGAAGRGWARPTERPSRRRNAPVAPTPAAASPASVQGGPETGAPEGGRGARGRRASLPGDAAEAPAPEAARKAPAARAQPPSPDVAPARAEALIPPSAPPALSAALRALEAAAEPGRAAGMAAYHKTDRPVFGTPNPAIAALATAWRAQIAATHPPQEALAARLALADGLWNSGAFEARIAAAKLLTQARIADDASAWDMLLRWTPEFDGWAIADAVASAAERRLAADPGRIADLAPFARAERLWTRRAALTFTLGFAKANLPGPEALAARETVLGWAAGMAGDPRWFIQKAIGWWLRTLSKRDPARVRGFLDAHGAAMKPFARREALRLIDGPPEG